MYLNIDNYICFYEKRQVLIILLVTQWYKCQHRTVIICYFLRLQNAEMQLYGLGIEFLLL